MNLLSIGGSDPSSGAGIQGDIKTFAAHGAYGLAVVTAVTSQNTSRFLRAEPVSVGMLGSQLDAVLSDFEIRGVKVGMVYTSRAARVLAARLADLKGLVPIVVDPVVRSTTGGILLRESALRDYTRLIVRIADVVTPNLHEARVLVCGDAAAKSSPRTLASGLLGMGAASAVITGITTRNTVTDVVAERDGAPHEISGPLLPGTTHGGGCAFSAALLCSLAGGGSLTESVRSARGFVMRHLRRPTPAGSGMGIISADAGPRDSLHAELARVLERFVATRNVYRGIPECQTNFVYSLPRPKTTKDVLGIMGRIVRAGDGVLVAGDLRYGGSKHVATALIAVSKKFPEVRSAVNVRYSNPALSAMRRAGLAVLSYDRRLEPKRTKSAGSTIRWGVSKSLEGVGSAPDAICHDGDHGKEPMILLFGRTPEDVLSKVETYLGSGAGAEAGDDDDESSRRLA